MTIQVTLVSSRVCLHPLLTSLRSAHVPTLLLCADVRIGVPLIMCPRCAHPRVFPLAGQLVVWDTRQSSSPIQKTKLSSNGHTFPVYWYVLLCLCKPLAAVFTTAARAPCVGNGDLAEPCPIASCSVDPLSPVHTIHTPSYAHTLTQSSSPPPTLPLQHRHGGLQSRQHAGLHLLGRSAVPVAFRQCVRAHSTRNVPAYVLPGMGSCLLTTRKHTCTWALSPKSVPYSFVAGWRVVWGCLVSFSSWVVFEKPNRSSFTFSRRWCFAWGLSCYMFAPSLVFFCPQFTSLCRDELQGKLQLQWPAEGSSGAGSGSGDGSGDRTSDVVPTCLTLSSSDADPTLYIGADDGCVYVPVCTAL